MFLKTIIKKLMQRENLDQNDLENAIAEILDPKTDSSQIAAFLVLLRAKPETPDEIAILIKLLRQKMISVPTTNKVLDIVGTGGDGANTINISTGSAILAASCGVKIAKVGNRAFSSLAGSADVLEALGINIELSPEKISQSIDEVGIAFCFSPNFYPAMKALRVIRKQLDVPTTFNLLGPLLNPTKPAHILAGVLEPALVPIYAEVLAKIGTERSVVAHGHGLDEISSIGPVEVIEVTQNTTKKLIIDPAEFGMARCHVSDLQGGNAQKNAEILLDVFSGKTGPIADTLILNAAVAIELYGLQSNLKDAVALARDQLFSNAALRLLNQWKEFSHG